MDRSKTSITESTSAMDDSKTNTINQTEFVDYVPTPEVKVLPPAKYKLWLIVFVLVYFASWVATEAGLREFLEFRGFLSFGASLFLQLGIVVFVLVYAAIDLFQTCLTFTTKSGTTYGVVAWLKQPRCQWVYRHENLFFEVCLRLVHILENGFAMLDGQPPQAKQHVNQQFECQDGACQTTLKIEHRIKPDRLDDYNKWVLRIRKTVQHWDGVQCVNQNDIVKEDLEEGGGSNNLPYLATVYVKFDNIDYLNDWMLSPRRKALMDSLEPLLERPDVVQIEKDRALPDAFSDLLTRQGNSVPKSPPRKWKVWWLTLVALFVTIHWSNSFLPYYLEFWGVSDLDRRLGRVVELFIVTFLNSYIMTPLFLFLFDHWLKDNVNNNRQPWKMLDRGLESIWSKVALTVAFYGGCVIAIVVQKYT